jgi:hypothetical protein
VKTKKYKLKILDVKTNYVRFKEVNLTPGQIEQLKLKINIVENGYKLLDVWEV